MMTTARKWAAVLLLAAICGLGILGLPAPKADSASAAMDPGTGSPPAQTGGIPGKLEGRDAERRADPPRITTAPSRYEPLDALVDPVFHPNTRANTDSTTYAQQEPSIAVNPLNPLNIVASAKDERSAPGPGTGTKEVWQYTSTDGGVTWFNQHSPLLGPHSINQSDPVNIFRDDGVVYACYLGYGTGGYVDTGIYVTQSTDGGFTWGNTAMAVSEVLTGTSGTFSTDKQWIAVDNNPTSPYYHRMYLSWTEFGACSGCIHFVYSTDGGVTWSSRANRISTAISGLQFSMPTVLWNGNVMVNWAQGTSIYYRISTDGGVTWGPQTIAGAMNTNLAMSGRQWRVNSIPVAAADRSTPGNIVITWNDGRNNSTNGVDIYYLRSTDGGGTWSAPARLNDDPTGVVRHQAEPWVTTSPNGTFHALWYDEREDTTSNIVFHMYYSQSTDAGATWSPNVRVSDATTNLNIGIPTGPGWNAAAGDYINLAATDTDVYGVWTDTRSGVHEDIYAVRGKLGGGGTPIPTPTRTNTPPTPPPPTGSATPTHTNTPPTIIVEPTNTSTPTGTITNPTGTNTPGLTATLTPEVTATGTPCAITFSDVAPSDYFYVPVEYMYCHGIISGYEDNTFRPYNLTTRSQMTKIVVLGMGIPLSTNETPLFNDVPTTNPFFVFVQTAFEQELVSGYICGGPGEPCDPPQNRPYFRPFNNVTRGQLSKMVVLAVPDWTLLNPPNPTFSDVDQFNAFYQYIETAYCHGIISGYADGTFLPGNNATRGQIAKITYLAILDEGSCGAATER